MTTIVRDSDYPPGYDAAPEFINAGADMTRNITCTVIDGKFHYTQEEPEETPVKSPKRAKKAS